MPQGKITLLASLAGQTSHWQVEVQVRSVARLSVQPGGQSLGSGSHVIPFGLPATQVPREQVSQARQSVSSAQVQGASEQSRWQVPAVTVKSL